MLSRKFSQKRQIIFGRDRGEDFAEDKSKGSGRRASGQERERERERGSACVIFVNVEKRSKSAREERERERERRDPVWKKGAKKRGAEEKEEGRRAKRGRIETRHSIAGPVSGANQFRCIREKCTGRGFANGDTHSRAPFLNEKFLSRVRGARSRLIKPSARCTARNILRITD